MTPAKHDPQPVDKPGEKPPRWMEYLPLDQLQPALVNPKGHDEELISASVSRFGAMDAVILDERTGRLVGGHGRLNDAKARRDAGQTPPDGFMLGEDGTWLCAVQRGWRSNSDDEAHAAGVALNEGTIAGGWKRDELGALLADIAGRDLDNLVGTGYDAASLDDLLATLGDEVLLPPGSTDAAHADGTVRGDPQAPREAQGLHEVGIILQADAHREFQALLAKLRHAWGEDVTGLVVLRAMREAAEALA